MNDVEKAEAVKKLLLESPKLLDRVHSILSIPDDSEGKYGTADEAEEATREALTKLGQEVLQNWATEKHHVHEQTLEECDQTARLRKKNFTGKQPMAVSP